MKILTIKVNDPDDHELIEEIIAALQASINDETVPVIN